MKSSDRGKTGYGNANLKVWKKNKTQAVSWDNKYITKVQKNDKQALNEKKNVHLNSFII